MLRFLFGLIFGLIIGAGGAYIYWVVPTLQDKEPEVTVKDDDPSEENKGRRKKGRKSRKSNEMPPTDLKATDRQKVSAGDSLKPRDMDLDMSKNAPPSRELSSAEINNTIRSRGAALGQCIVDAVGGAPLQGETVDFGMVVDPNGKVIKTRVEAPRYAMKRGLAKCASAELRRLSFPAPGRDVVVRVPFTIE